MLRNITLLLAICLLLPFAALSATPSASLYVQVKSTKLRTEPKFWSAQTAELNYGSVVAPLSAASGDKSWLKVKFGSKEGFLHVSAVTKRKIVLSGQDAPKGKSVDQSSIVVAGKGFNSQVENRYRSAKGLDYAAVDEVGRLGVTWSEESAFIAEGKLNS